MQVRRTPSIADLLTPVFRFKWRALFVIVVAVGLSAAYAEYGQKVYESEAELLVRIGRENAALDPTLRVGETISLRSSREEEINSIVAHLRSRAIVEKVFNRLHAESTFPSAESRERSLRTLRDNIEITSPRASTVIKIWAKQDSPERAQEVVNDLVEVYMEEHMRIHRSTKSYDFFAEKSNAMKKLLDEAQFALRDTKNRIGIGSIEGRRTALESQFAAIESQIQSVNSDLAASRAKTDSLRKTVGELPEALLQQLVGGTPNDGLAAMQSQLFELKVLEKQLLSDLRPDHPKVTAVRQQVSQVEEALAGQDAERNQLITALLSQELALQASLEAQRMKLEQQRLGLTTEITQLNGVEVEVVELQRTIQRLENDYLNYTERRELSRMDQQLQEDQISNLSLFQPATFVPDHISPRRAKTLLMGGGAGCVLAWLLIVLSNALYPRRDERPWEANGESMHLGAAPNLPADRLQPPVEEVVPLANTDTSRV